MPAKEIAFSQVLKALLDVQTPFPPTFLHRFSDLKLQDVNELKKIWQTIPDSRRINLMEDLENLLEADTLVDFSDLSRLALGDALPPVRACALRLLWEFQDNKLIPTFLNMMDKDPDDVVRATAATALGQYVYLGEVDEVAPAALSRIEDALIKKLNGSDSPLVRRRALESLGFSSRHEVPPLIRKYLDSSQTEWIASALFSLGRSADPQWESDVLSLINSPEPDVQLEAVKAAGSLGLSNARQPLLDLLESADELDDEVRISTIWSLSEIGGDSVLEKLESLLESCEDDEEVDLIEEAIENLEFSSEGLGLGFLAIPPADEENLDLIIDLEEDEAEEDTAPKKQSKKKK